MPTPRRDATGPCRAAERRRARAGVAVLGTCLLLGLLLAGSPPARGEAEPTRATMRRALDALATLLPAAVAAPAEWREATGRSDVKRALTTLEDAARTLREHRGPEPRSFAFFSRELHRDARTIARRVERERYDSAAFLTRRLTETCVDCHTRLPADDAFDVGDALLGRIDTGTLAPLARARLQVTTRQFDAALQSYEDLFLDPEVPPAQLEREVPAYLTLVLRVRRDPEHAERGLARLAMRRDLPAHLAQNLIRWRAAIDDLAPALDAPPTLGRARRLLAQGRALHAFPSDQADLAHVVIASSVIYRFLEEVRPQGRELAEAFYLLGQAEVCTHAAFELSDAEYYLEQTIRLAPHTALAGRAYAHLERETLLAFTGSSGTRIPPDVETRLEELRELSRIAPVDEDPEPGAAPEPEPDADSGPEDGAP